MNKAKILIVEDDTDLLDTISEFLNLEGFEVRGTTCALDFFQTLLSSDFEIAVVDIGLPDRSGFEIVRHLRERTDLGIIILTARDNIKDKMTGYDAGADYYFVKPLDSRELVAAVNNLLIRLSGKQHSQAQREPADEWVLENRTWTLISPYGHKTTLTTKEYNFLKLIIGKNGLPVERVVLLESMGYNSDEPYGNRALDVMLVRLRKKIKSTSPEEAPIKTVHSIGFCFSAPVKQV